MGRLRTVPLAVVTSVVLASAVALAPQTEAHGIGVIIVPQQYSGRAHPNVDASCEADYRRSGNSRPLLYQPRVNFAPATVYLLMAEDYLYVCVRGMPRTLPNTTTHPYLSLVFDANHDGGSAPDSDDINFSVDESGQETEYHGNGVGFAPSGYVQGWGAVVDRSTEVTWNAEFLIHRSKIGSPHGGSVVGFQVRQNSLAVHNDAFSWPTDSENRQPRTWGDLFFLGAPSTTPGPVRFDDGRVTQGLEWDIAQGANKPYDFIAGKDAMVEGRLFTLGAITDVTYRACRVQAIAPVVGAAHLVPVDASLSPRINTAPTGRFGSMGDFRCWIPGSLVDTPGVYRFSLVVQMSGGDQQIIDVATRAAQTARAVRLMVYRWIFPTGHLENRAWDATLNASASDAMRDLQRVLPVPAGVGPFAFDGTPAPGAAGLRYFFAPTVYQCVVDDGETQAEAVSRCNATTRNNADLARISYDQQSADRDRVDGQHRDRIDLQEVYVSTPESGGGQSCWSNSASAGSGLDSLPSGQSHFVPIQETQHCWFQLRGYSPHSDPTNRPHSLNDYFYAAGGHPLVNLQTRQEVATPRGVMSPFFYPGVDHNTDFVNEGFEFDDLRQTLLALPAPSGNASAVAPASVLADPPVGTTQFQIAFLMNHVDHTITLQSAQRLDNSTTKPTTPKPTSPYSLVFRNASNAVVGSPLPFGVTTMGTHDGPITIEGQVLIADLPAGAASAEIDKDGVGTALLTQDFTAAAPQVTSFTSTPNGTHVLDLAWKGSDNDGPALSYSVYLQQHPGALRSLIASGLTDESYAFDTAFAPGTSDGVLTVEASDGFNIGTATVSNVSIAVKKPVVSISTPRSGATLVAARPLRLVGSAYDLNTMGELAGKNLTWSLDGKVIGTGQARTLTGLIAGTHTITLAAVSGGLSASRTYKITVVPDSDKDGMPNSFETTYSCLDAKHYDSAGDPDGDQLSSFAEWQHHTSPCRADTDKDGWSDGDEVAQGTDPKSAKLAPRPARIFLDTEPRSLGSCSSPSVVNLHVGTSTSTVRWTAASDEPFVSAKGGRTGAGTLTIAPACVGLPAGHSYRAQVGVENAIGQFYTIEVRFKS